MSEIQSESLLAVKSLRSRFEQLSVDPGSPRQTPKPLSLEPPSSPRPRAQSGGNSSMIPPPSPISPSLRNASSSSDLKSTKRPPPPPPPLNRSPRAPSPSPLSSRVQPSSPLLRPVPPPPVSRSMGALSTSNNLLGSTEELNNNAASVSALRNKFMTLSPNGLQAPKEKPLIPPRRSSQNKSSESLIPSIASPEKAYHAHTKSSSSHSTSSSSSSVNLLDDSASESEDSDLSSTTTTSNTTLPPVLPMRKPHPGGEPPARTSTLPPPRPPPRHRLTPDSLPEISTSLASSSLSPPLPARRGSAFETLSAPPRHSAASGFPAPPPSHHTRFHSSASVSSVVDTNLLVSPIATTPIASCSTPALNSLERRTFGNLPPPPTRTIALGDKLPPARKELSPTEDEDEDSDEEVAATDAVDMLPDSSNSSRRPPYLVPGGRPRENGIVVPAHTGHLVMTHGRVVVVDKYDLKVFDVERRVDYPVLSIDLKALVRESKGSASVHASALQVRCAFASDEKGKGKENIKSGAGGSLVWVGTKEGHLIEVNVITGEITSYRFSAHLHAVAHIFRYGSSMVSIDESGKALIFGDGGGEMDLLRTTPRAMRLTDKLDFAKILGNGLLWAASRSDQQGGGTLQRVPVIRIYDLFPGTASGGGRIGAVVPCDPAGSVTCAAVVPSNPDFVYVGHEGGHISIWEMGVGKEMPKCVEVMKVGGSDVLSMEGVHNRLWVGTRNGQISVYDVEPRPWLMTNGWAQHGTLPVRHLVADVWGLTEGKRRLGVVSIGRDETVGLWDGLLATHWMDKELLKHEMEFSTFRQLKVLIVSWNCDSARPDSLNGTKDNIDFLHNVLTSLHAEGGPDIIVFGLQEVIDLEDRRIVAKNVLVNATSGNQLKKGKEKHKEKHKASNVIVASGEQTVLQGLSDKVTGAYKRWFDALVLAVKLAMPVDCPYSVIHTESMIGLFTCIFIRQSERSALKDLSITTVKRGMGGRYGNKGGIISRFVIDDSSLCFINCHLAAGQHALRSRNADVAGILEEKDCLPVTMEPQAFVGGGDGSMVMDHETVFVNGDMNYRIDQRRDNIVNAVKAGEHETMLAHDQLLKEVKYNRGCRFRAFTEGPITFPPTYKYNRRSNEYDSSEKRRAPAWCDRVLWRAGKGRIEQTQYRRWEVDVSDHRPISSAFRLTVKNVRQEVRQSVRQEVEMRWHEEEDKVVRGLEAFYRQTGVL